jgi:NhaC family Na+:H+ antiporter
MSQSPTPKPYEAIPLWIALVPVVVLILFLTISISIFGDDATGGPSQVALIAAGFLAALIALARGITWHSMEAAILKNVGVVAQAILILILVGSLIGTWILGGIVPSLIVWGLELLHPSIFLVVSVIISGIVSLATGSSWSTAGTLGLALIGIGNTMGIHPGLSAGAVISGAYFGDKMSPFSETTNLASSMVSTELFTHIRHMLYTTTPSLLISLVIFLVIGLTQSTEGYDPDKIQSVIHGIDSSFDTSLYILLPVVILIYLVYKKTPAIPALIIGSIMGIIMAVAFQGSAVVQMAGNPDLGYTTASVKSSLKAAALGFKSHTGIETVDKLLSRGGMSGMLTTIWLIISAMFFSGIMEGSGMLQRIADSILQWVKGTGNLIAATLGSAIFMNITAPDQYLSIVITGRMYKDAYDKEGLAPKNLSRALEDSGTLSSALIPWNTCGAFMAAALGVGTLTYLPFAFLNLLNPVISLIYGYTGFSIEKIDNTDNKNHEKINSGE